MVQIQICQWAIVIIPLTYRTNQYSRLLLSVRNCIRPMNSIPLSSILGFILPPMIITFGNLCKLTLISDYKSIANEMPIE